MSDVAIGYEFRVFGAQLRAQVLGFLRMPAVSATSLVLPVFLYAFFAIPHAHEPSPANGMEMGRLMLGTLGAYAISSMMVFNFGVMLATERAQKIDLLLRASPLAPATFLLARAATAVVYGLAALLILLVVAMGTGAVQLAVLDAIELVVKLLAGAVPFIGLGFALGYLVSPAAAPAVANLLYMAIAFSSGMFIPLEQLPAPVQRIAPYLPTYHLAQLAIGAVGAPSESAGTAFLWLAGFTVAFGAMSLWGYGREVARRFT